MLAWRDCKTGLILKTGSDLTGTAKIVVHEEIMICPGHSDRLVRQEPLAHERAPTCWFASVEGCVGIPLAGQTSESDRLKTRANSNSSKKAGRKRKAGASISGGAAGTGKPLDPEVERWFTTAGVAFPATRSSMIPMLQSAQTALGYLPRDAMQAIARHLVVPPALVEGVASFYAQFRFNKPGRHRMTVCTGTACYVRGSGKLLDDIRAGLKIGSGETTADGAVSLESVSCFGACALAPVVVLDDKVLRQQTSESVKRIVRDVTATPAKGGSRASRAAAARGSGK